MRFAFRERELMALVHSGELEVDTEGRIWQLRKRKGTGHRGGLQAKVIERRRAESQLTPRGYLRLQRWINHRCIACYAHRLVWQALHGDIPDGLEVNHINGVKSDNRPENLELWASHPKGQRVADLVEFVALNYPEEVMRAISLRVNA